MGCLFFNIGMCGYGLHHRVLPFVWLYGFPHGPLSACNLLMMVILHLVGQKVPSHQYDLVCFYFYFVAAGILYAVGMLPVIALKQSDYCTAR